MATVLGSLFLAGATIGALSLILPHPSEYDSSALWSNVGDRIRLRARRASPSSAPAGLGPPAVRPRRNDRRHPRRLLRARPERLLHVLVPLDLRLCVLLLRPALGRRPGGRRRPRLRLGAHSGLRSDACAALGGDRGEHPGRRAAGGCARGPLRRESRAAAMRASNLEAVSEVARQLATQSDSRAVGWAICSAAVRDRGGIRGGALAADDLRRCPAGRRRRGRGRRGRAPALRDPGLGRDPGLHLGRGPLRAAARGAVRPGARAGLRGGRRPLGAGAQGRGCGGRRPGGLLARPAGAT